MTNHLQSIVETLLSYLNQTPHGIPLDEIKIKLSENSELKDSSNRKEVINEAIEYALDNWLIDKVIDSPTYEDGIPVGSPTWLLKKLEKDESNELQSLPAAKKAYLKILRSSGDSAYLGMISEDDALKRLGELGFELDRAPHISDRTQIIFDYDEGKLVRWCSLIPEFEKTEEAKQAIRQLEEKNMRE